MDLSDHLEELKKIHPSVYLFFFFSIGTVIYLALDYWYEEKLEDAKREIEFEKIVIQKKLSEIERRIGPSRNFNLSELLTSKYRVANQEKSIVEFSEGFRAYRNFNNFKYFYRPEIQQDSDDSLYLPYELYWFQDVSPAHVWRGAKVFTQEIEHFDETKEYREYYPYISLQKWPVSRLNNAITEIFEGWEAKEDENKEVSERSKLLKESVQRFVENPHRNIAGPMFIYIQTINLFQSVLIPETDWDLVSAQKDGVVLRSVNVFTIKDAILDGKEGEAMYTRVEQLLIKVPQSVYSVRIVSPSRVIASNAAFEAKVNEWFGGLRLYYD